MASDGKAETRGAGDKGVGDKDAKVQTPERLGHRMEKKEPGD